MITLREYLETRDGDRFCENCQEMNENGCAKGLNNPRNRCKLYEAKPREKPKPGTPEYEFENAYERREVANFFRDYEQRPIGYKGLGRPVGNKIGE